MGVEFKTGVEIGKTSPSRSVREQGYKAFFLAIGAHRVQGLGIPGEDLEGVLSRRRSLRRCQPGRSVTELGDRVAVVGGGNVAMDAVRTRCALGRQRSVIIVYRRS